MRRKFYNTKISQVMRITLYFQGRENAESILAIMNCFRYTHLIMAFVWTTDLVSNYWKFRIQFASNIEHSDSETSKQLIKGHGLIFAKNRFLTKLRGGPTIECFYSADGGTQL